MPDSPTDLPPLILLSPDALASVRRRLFAGDPSLMAADDRLIQEANQALGLAPRSVLDKVTMAPSGVAKDYASIDPARWPDENSADGLPYMRRLEAVNPEVHQWDQVNLNVTCSAINTLSLAYYLSDLEEFAAHAALLLRTWFLDEASGMSPHLDYAGLVPGRCDGDHRGISEGLPFLWMIDAVGLLAESASWTSDDDRDLRLWFQAYLKWLRHSDNGHRQALEPDHHGTWYDVQVAAIGLFLGDDSLCREVATETAKMRVAEQIDEDGRQAYEVAKSLGLRCSVTNLGGLFELADLATRFGVDLWTFESPEGGSIRRAFYWLAERSGEGPAASWTDFETAQFLPLSRRGRLQFGDSDCEERLLHGADFEWPADRTNLLYPVHGENDFS